MSYKYHDLLKVDKFQAQFGMKNVYPDQIINIRKSLKPKYKYSVSVYHNNVIHNINFGDKDYEQYYDKIGEYSKQDHYDKNRRHDYLARSSKIRNKYNELTLNDPLSANYYSMRLLW